MNSIVTLNKIKWDRYDSGTGTQYNGKLPQTLKVSYGRVEPSETIENIFEQAMSVASDKTGLLF